MASTIIIKQSSVASKVPTTGDLQEGELAINTADAKIFTKNDSNEVIELGGGSADTLNKTQMSAGAITAVGNLLQYTGVIIEYSHGSDVNGYVNTTEEITDGTYSPNLVSDATNYLKQIEGNSTPQGYATHQPVYGASVFQSDWYLNGIWHRAMPPDPDGDKNTSTTDATPTMTSENTPSGVVTASDELTTSYAPWKAFNDSQSDGWLTPSSQTTGWIQYQFPTAIVINKYTIAAPLDTQLTSGFRNWTLQASNTGAFGGEEVIIDTVTNVGGWGANLVRTFSAYNSTPYLHYRIDATLNYGGSYIGTEEIQLIEALGNQAPDAGTEYDPTITYLPYTVDVDAGGNITSIDDFTGVPSFYTDYLSLGELQLTALPISDPGTIYTLWNDNGTVKISAG